MTRCAAFNADPRAVEFVERVWVFGSMINPDKPDVGDIDIVIETGRRPDFPKGRKDWDEEMHARYPEHVHRHWSSYHEEWSVERVRHKEIYGARKHQLLSLTSIHTLESLHQPCQLLFDEARGGLVNDPVLPFHPESKGRGDDIRPRRVMPSLETSEFAPTDLRWLGTYMPSTATSEFKMLADEEACARAGVTAPTGIDGRYVLGILVTDGTGRKTVVTIKRDYVSAPDGPEFLIANISPPNILQAFDRDTQEMIVKQARRCALVDLIRLAARRNEMGIPRMIYADLTFDCGSAGDWAILGRDGERPPTIPEEQQFSLDITENGKRVHSRPDVSRFTPMDWRRFRLTVGISMADYNNRFEVDPADDPDEAAPPSL